MIWKIAIASAAVAFAALSVPAQAVTVDFGLIPAAGNTGAAYTGASLNASTAFDFGGPVQVFPVGPDDTTGTTNFTPVTLSPQPWNYTTTLTKSWDGYTETLHAALFAPPVANQIGIDLAGTLTGNGVNQSVFAIFNANQAAGPGGAISWAFTNTSTAPTGLVPLPGALVLFGSVIAGGGVLMRRRRGAAAVA